MNSKNLENNIKIERLDRQTDYNDTKNASKDSKSSPN